MSALHWSVVGGTLVVVVDLVLRAVALGTIPANRKPSTGMAWVLLIFVQPILGYLIFGTFGRTAVGRRRHERQQSAFTAIAARTAEIPESAPPPEAPAYVASVAALNLRLGALPLVPDNSVEMLPVYDQTMARMAEAVRAARTYVHVEFYIMAWDEVTEPVLQALMDAAERGVQVKLLFDHLGSRGLPDHKDLVARLEASSIEWRAMLPLNPLRGVWRRPDLRNHRKLMVVDGRVGFTGSLNLTEPGYHKPKNHELGRKWVELMVRLEGPVVAELDAVFASDWFVETEERVPVEWRPSEDTSAPTAVRGVPGQVVPSGPGFVTENNLRFFTTLIYGATSRLSLTSPYFVPDESLLYAVTTAAQRGVDVELFVSETSDQFMVGHAQASYYQALLEAGVRIYLYPTPLVLHSKHFTVDDEVAVIGSSNMDLRSFALNYEISLMLLGSEVVGALRKVEDGYRTASRQLTLEEWSQRSRGATYVDTVMRLTAALQ